MLLRMYLRWAERRHFKADLIEADAGEEAGLKSATLTLAGDNAYGDHPRREGRPPARPAVAVRQGRIARTPRSRASRRHRGSTTTSTSTSTRRTCASTRTARRAPAASTSTRPTRPSASRTCRRARRPVPERALAAAEPSRRDARFLKSRLLELELKRREEELAKERGESQDISFGSQIRSYVLHPYTMVNDHRTNLKDADVQGVLDGDLDRSSARTCSSGRRTARNGECGPRSSTAGRLRARSSLAFALGPC